jgi:hypothetical protein
MYKNCREYISGEIEVLRPDILVTQGAKSRELPYASPADQQGWGESIFQGETSCGFERTTLALLGRFTVNAGTIGQDGRNV